MRMKKIKANQLEKRPYTTRQILGIVGILIFLLPIFWIIGVMLQKGLYLLFILLFGWIEFHNTVYLVIKTIFFVLTTFLLFLGVYLVCEMMWPKRFIDKIKSDTKEGVEPKQVY